MKCFEDQDDLSLANAEQERREARREAARMANTLSDMFFARPAAPRYDVGAVIDASLARRPFSIWNGQVADEPNLDTDDR